MNSKGIISILSLSSGILLAGESVRYPQESLPKQEIKVCGINLSVWVAKTVEERNRGLMNFRPLGKSEGMLFVFSQEEEQSFWMKNVPYDLDIAFFDREKRLVSFSTMKGTSPLLKEVPSYQSGKPALFAVEARAGSFTGFSAGCKLIIKDGL